MTFPTSTVQVMVNGMAIVLEELEDLRVQSSLLETSLAVLRFADRDWKLIDGATWSIGATVQVKMGSETAWTSVFKGEVTAIGSEQFGAGRNVLVVEAMDKSHRLSANIAPTTYLNKSSSEIVQTIARAYGLQAVVTATQRRHEYLLKTVNDRAFITQLAEEIGYEWFVKEDQLLFRPRPDLGTPVVSLSWDDGGLHRLSARASAVDGAKSVEVRGWDDAKRVEIVGTANAATPSRATIGSNAPLATSTYQGGAKSYGNALHLAPGVLVDTTEATALATAIAGDLQASTLRIRGECEPTPLIAPGVWLKIADCGTKVSGDYYVTECEHAIGVGQSLVTRFRLSGRRAGGLAAARPAGERDAFGQVGLVIGIVTNTKDEEKKMHRVKVRFPTLPNLESAWARVVTLGGSTASGMEARPDVDDEVLVGFERGDPRRPFVLGGLLSKTDNYRTGSVNSDGKINKRGIRTRSGHRLEMFDGASASATTGRYIALTAADGKTEVRIADEKVSVITKDGNPIELQSGTAKIVLNNGAVTIQADTIELKATRSAKIQGLTVDLKGTQAVGIAADGQLQAQGATVSVAGKALTEIKGMPLKLN